ncbi:Conserved oligomeric Golgi complex subunit 2 [Hondaea fermentalgiana]|uniref:Conserved oligomeric Golgi complex subunit 2 n=1 Tax=Hondaea fermentalgiana TaxID=2315210 RepID=A0A2R5GA65_9STRA|nr:Conserved oligomeric Golgi complex subunit 2 [Hondaea fermentalgiana]|eukprot:GBG26618.1 Conserved oligomeric Golgi complex subunit 2 [Hondaea fermentalgiana]
MFTDEVFLQEGFRADAFVAEHRKDLTLKNLESELEAYVANLDNTLVNIINNDYSAFLKLSSMLVDIDSLVAGLREPLTLLERKVQDARKVVSDPLEKQRALLDRLLYVREKRKLIQLCLSAWETLEKVERQVEQLRAEDDQDRGSTITPSGVDPIPANKSGRITPTTSLTSATAPTHSIADAHENPAESRGDTDTHSHAQGASLASPASVASAASSTKPDMTGGPSPDLQDAAASASGFTTAGKNETNGEALGRATQRLARVTFLAQENSGLPLLRMIRAKARSLEHSLIEQLELALVQVVGPDGFAEQRTTNEVDQARVRQIAVVLRAYMAINHTQEATEVFRRRVVQPSLQKILTQGRIDAGGARGIASGLQGAYGDVLRFLQTTCRPMLAAIHDPNEGLADIDLLGSSVVEGLAQVIKDQMSYVYSSGNADVLHATYLKTEAFFRILRSLAPHPERVDHVADRVLAMWNLSVYAQLRSQDMTRQLEEALVVLTANEDSHGDATHNLRLPASIALVNCFEECWSEKVVLSGVAARIFKLVVQLVFSYLAWSEASIRFVASENDVTLSMPSEEEAASEELREAADARAAAAAQAWGDAPCNKLILLCVDNLAIASFLANQVPRVQDVVVGRATGSSQGAAAKEAVQRAINEHLGQELCHAAARARRVVEQSVLAQCTETVLAGMKGVTPMYRMTNKPPPTQACEYAAKTLEPVETFLASEPAQLLDNAPASAATILESVLVLFDEQASRALEEITTSENALRRLNRNTGKRQLDSTKIRAQFFLDLERIVQSARQAGVDVDQVQGYSELRAKLAPTASSS